MYTPGGWKRQEGEFRVISLNAPTVEKAADGATARKFHCGVLKSHTRIRARDSASNGGCAQRYKGAEWR
jgi:hypothetical protein